MLSQNANKIASINIIDFFSQSSLGLFVAGAEGKILEINLPLTKLFGEKSRESFLNRYPDISQLLDDISLVNSLFALRGKETKNLDKITVLTNADDEKFTVRLWAEWVIKDQSQFLYGFFNPISEVTTATHSYPGLSRDLRAMFSNVQDFFYIKDAKGNLIAGNPVYHRLIEQNTNSAETEKQVLNLFHDNDLIFIQQNKDAIVQNGEIPNQKEIDSGFALRRIGIPGPDGKLQSILVYGHDFTILMKSERSLVDSQTNLQAIIESAQDSICVIDPDYRFVKINSHFKNFTADFFNTHVQEGDSSLTFLPENLRKEWMKVFNKALKGQFGRQDFSLSDGGFEFSFEFTVNPVFDLNQKIAGLTVFISDNTERKLAEDVVKESESRFRQLAENTNDALVLNNREGIIYVNPAFEKLFGFTQQMAYDNPDIIDRSIALSDQQRYQNSKNQSLKRNKLIQGQQYKIISADSKAHPVWIRSFPIYNTKGDPYRQLIVISDLTEQVELEHAVSNSRLQQKAILDNIPYLAWLKDDAGRYISVNEAFAKFFGINPNDIIGKTDREIFSPEIAARNEKYDIEVKKAGKRRLKEDYWQKSSVDRWFETFSAPILTEDKELIGITGISRDITDRKAMEETIIKNEEHFRSLLQYSSDSITILDENGNIIFESSLKNRISDFTIDELIGKSYEIIVHPDDFEIFRDIIHEVRKIPGSQIKREYRCLHKHKRWIYVESIFSNHLNNPSIKGIVVNTRDVSDRKMSELKERVYHDNLIFLSNSALDLLGLSDREDIFHYIANKLHTFLEDAIVLVAAFNDEKKCFQVLQISGQEKHKQTINHILGYDPIGLEFGHNRYPVNLENAGNITIYNGNPDSFILDTLTQNQSQSIFQELRVNKLYNISMARDNKLLGNISILTLNKTIIKFKHILETFVHQISVALHRSQLEFELVKAKTRAEESDMLKTAFLANMSHEIRTPMNGILGFAEMLNEEQISDNNRKKYVEIINSNGKMLMNLIDDIIDFSKIEAGQIKILRQEFSLNNLLSQIHSSFLSESLKKEKNNVKLRIRKALTNEECYIQTDPNRLRQVLTNLVGNAFKFTHEGYIEFGYFPPKNGIIEFYVKDTGIGVAKNKIDVIFDRFVQADYSRSRKYSGSGLGLAISKGFVELLGGKMWAESEENEGSTFYFSIPYIPALKQSKEDVESKKPKSDYNWENRIFLIAEDDKFSYKLLEGFLKKTNAEIIHAEDGAKAVEICKNSDNIDLILMDVQMPEMNGMEATRIIKQMRKNLPIIAQTANAIAEEKQRCFEAGFDDFVTKPINISELFAKIDLWLTQK